MSKTNIEWVVNPDGSRPGYTWNPITGCLNHIDGLCKGGGFPCYAYRLANGRLKQRYLANTNVVFPDADTRLPTLKEARVIVADPFYPRFWEDRLQELIISNTHPHKPRGIFPCDMSDLFGVGIPESRTARVLDVIRGCWQDRFYLLTKQPQNLIKFSPFPDNCWVGVTATDVPKFAEACDDLAEIEATIRFISLEPLLDFEIVEDGLIEEYLTRCKINWLIIGAQTKPYKPPKIEWVREIVEAADRAGIPVFLKDNLRPLFFDKVHDLPLHWGITPVGKLRQEMPE